MDADFIGLDGVHVLVVAAVVVILILKHRGALGTTAGSAAEAHRILALLRPVLVTDGGIPQDRLGLLRAVQALAQGPGVQIPAIGMTTSQSEQAEFWAAGFTELLVKSLDAMELCRVVRRHVGQN